jgi:glycosyltransferase involved in cell wall biosynthesis
MKNGISVFMPVYNLTHLIIKNLRVYYNALMQLDDNSEIVIVDDNSSEKNFRLGRMIAKARHATGKDIRYIQYRTGPTRRENLAASFHLAKHEIIGFLDADFSCDVSYFLKAVQLLREKNADIVVGSRYIEGAKVKMRAGRRIASFFYNLIVRLIFKSGIHDHQCGLKVFRRNTVMPIVDRMGYDDTYIRGWFWDAELLIRAQREGLKIIEMPVEWNCSRTTTFNLLRELRCLNAMIGLKRDLMNKRNRHS